jgi:hypothetical protein
MAVFGVQIHQFIELFDLGMAQGNVQYGQKNEKLEENPDKKRAG